MPQVSEVGKGASALLLYHGEGSGSCPCLAPLEHLLESGEGSVPCPAPGADQPAQGAEFITAEWACSCRVGEEEPSPRRDNRQECDTSENVLERLKGASV